MKAVILAAGESTRTYPLTIKKPKGLLKVMGILYEGRAPAKIILKPIKEPKLLETVAYNTTIADAFGNDTIPEKIDAIGDSLSEDLIAMLILLKDCSPESTQDYAALMNATLLKLGDAVQYFRSASPDDRAALRAFVGKYDGKLAMIATEARQLLRNEENYQNYLTMNQLDNNTGGTKW